MNFYKQTNRETGEVIAFLTCSSRLKDDDEEIKLDELTEEEYSAEIMKIKERQQEEEVIE